MILSLTCNNEMGVYSIEIVVFAGIVLYQKLQGIIEVAFFAYSYTGGDLATGDAIFRFYSNIFLNFIGPKHRRQIHLA